MIKKPIFRIRLKIALLLTIFLVSSVYLNYNTREADISYTESDSLARTDENILEPIEEPKPSIVGNASWWDIDFLYRQLIVITNDNPTSLEKYPVKIQFNYSKLVADGKMNSALKDIRIIEGGSPSKYYFLKDYPKPQLVTVWFDTTIAAGPGTTEYDTYLYFGNMAAKIDETYFMNESSSDSADAFGWIRNGDFDLIDPDGPNERLTDFFGWKWSNQPPTDLKPGGSANGTESFIHGLVETASNQERLYGNYTFKWGTTYSYVDGSLFPGGGYIFDFEGRLYSYPFITPKIDAGKKLYINLFRNIRVYNEKPQGEMTFFVRISNATRNYDNPGSSSDSVEYFQEYKMGDRNLGFTYMQKDPVNPKGYGPTPVDTRNDAVPPYEEDGQLTGLIKNTFEIPSAWQGQLIFLEIGMYGIEDKWKMAIGQVDNVSYNYKLDADLQNIQEVQTEITIITKDVDGRIVPNANVYLVDKTKILRSDVTDLTGTAHFSNIGYGTYNFTVEYTLNTGQKGVVYDSTKPGERNFTFDESQSFYEEILILNMTTIDFEIVDWAGRPLDYGFINIKTSKTGKSLENRTLDSRGTTTFRWFNISSYYFEVYYDNQDYANNPIKLNESYILRSDYVKDKEKFQTQIFNVNETNLTPGTTYKVNQYVYTNGSSTEIGNKKIINFTVTLEKMDNFISNVTIYYVDRANSTEGNLIFTKTDYNPSDTSDEITITLRDPPIECANLVTDKYEVYGLLIIVKGVNNTVICNGTIKVDLVETWNVFNRTILARMKIQVVSGENPIDVATVHVEIGPDSIINLTSYVDKGPELLDSDGYVFGRKNYLIPFWYFIGRSYNLSVTISSVKVNFKVNKTLNGQWKPTYTIIAPSKYNLTMTYDNGIVILDTDVTPAQVQTRFSNMTITEEVDWGDIINVRVYYEFTIGAGWTPITDSNNVMITISAMGADSKTYLTDHMNIVGGGSYTYSFNSDILSAGVSSKSYIVIISADEEEYIDPSNAINYTIVNAKETDLSLHEDYPDYDVMTEFSQYFGELINISIRYYDNDTKTSLTGASVYYDWLNLGNTQFYEDPMNNSYYTVTLNTSLALYVGPQSIKITAYKENYTIQQNILISLRILDRQTSLNGKSDLIYISRKVWVQDEELFNFTYKDITYGSDMIIGDLELATYTWQELTVDGDPIIGNDGTGILIQNPDKVYTLDFNTQLRPVGYYFLSINMKKDNYELRGSYINLEIRLREFDADLEATNLEDDQINVVKGEDIKFEIELFDTTRGDIPLRGARVKLEIGDEDYEFDEDDPGIYSYTFSTDEIDAFFTSQTFTGEIIIKMDNFTSEEIDITIVVNMEEIVPGMPTFYFIMLIAVIAGTIGGLVTYRVIQQARIPNHVKKIRLVKKKIKARDSVPKTISVPTKEQLITKQFSDAWKDLGLSLEKTLGIKDMKSKIPTKEKEPIKENGGKE